MKQNIERHYRFDSRTLAKVKERCRNMNISEAEYVRRLVNQDMYPLNQNRMQEIVKQITNIANAIGEVAVTAELLHFEKSDLLKIESFKAELAGLHETLLAMKSKAEGRDG